MHSREMETNHVRGGLSCQHEPQPLAGYTDCVARTIGVRGQHALVASGLRLRTRKRTQQAECLAPVMGMFPTHKTASEDRVLLNLFRSAD